MVYLLCLYVSVIVINLDIGVYKIFNLIFNLYILVFDTFKKL